MNVMTFNIRGAFHDDGENVWEKRRDLNTTTILKHDPDIIGFQEMQQGNTDDYVGPLSHYEVEMGLPSSARNSERVPVYWKRDRYQKIDSGGFYLSDTPDEWSIGWEASLPRAVTWVRLQPAYSDKPFVVLNTHYPHRQEVESTRENCSRLIVERLRDIGPDDPIIVMADFNARPDAPSYQTFIDAGFMDTYAASAYTENINTYHGFLGEDFPHSGGRIDWILTRGFSVTNCVVITDSQPPIHASDHYPVMATVELSD